MATWRGFGGASRHWDTTLDWFRDELGQMGLWPEHISHAERYAIAREWVQALKRLWQEERVTFQGRYVRLQDCISNPKPLQKPHPRF